MLKTVMTRSALIAFACSISLSVYAIADGTKRAIDIPSGDLATALQLLAKQSGSDLVYRPDHVQGFATGGVSGDLSTEEAVTKLLKGTPLILSTDSTGAMLIALPTAGGSNEAPQASKSTSERSKSFWSRLRLAPSDSASPAQAYATNRSPSQGEGEAVELEEIIVSAQKRGRERLQDVPVPVSVLNASELASTGQALLRDYYARVPGLRLSMNGSTQALSVRGITTGSGNPTVAVVIDEAPYGGSTNRVNAGQVPDIDPGDLARVEILRGPQGTLYGASSMGGLVKFVTKDPSTEGYAGHLEAGTSSIKNGEGLGYNLRGSVNVPLSDTWAVRASGFTRRDSGYIDNVFLGRDGINELQAEGGRVSALWHAGEDFSLKLSALYQQTRADSQSSEYLLPGLAERQRNDPAGVGPYQRTTQAYSALINAKLGTVDLTSVTAFNKMRFDDAQNYSFIIPQATVLANFGVTSAGLWSHFTNDRFAQEVRLSGSLGEIFEWVAGAFYDHEQGPFHQNIYALNATSGAVAGEFADLDNPGDFREYAAFADLTWHLTDRFDIQIGGRQSHHESTGSTTQIGIPPSVNNSPVIIPKAVAEGDAFTYLFTPRFKVSDDLMVYARLASGYRPAGFNRPLPETPLTFKSDKTLNYEIGLKGNFLDRRLSVDTSLFYIDWQDIQLQRTNPQAFNYLTNGSRAKSEGVELSLESRPAQGLTIAGWISYDKAILTEGFPVPSPTYAVAGDPLPINAKWSGNLSLQQDFRLSSNATGFVEGVVSYVGERTGLFRGVSAGVPLPRDVYPSYTQTDLRVGATYESWTANLFVNNVADKRGIVNGGAGFFPGFSYFYIQPRTIGMSVSKDF